MVLAWLHQCWSSRLQQTASIPTRRFANFLALFCFDRAEWLRPEFYLARRSVRFTTFVSLSSVVRFTASKAHATRVIPRLIRRRVKPVHPPLNLVALCPPPTYSRRTVAWLPGALEPAFARACCTQLPLE